MMTADGFSSGILFHFDYIINSALEWKMANCHNSLQIFHEVPGLFKNAHRKSSLYQWRVESVIFQCSARIDVVAVRHYTARATLPIIKCT